MAKRLTDKELVARYAEVDATFKKAREERKRLAKEIKEREKSVLRGEELNLLVFSITREIFDFERFRESYEKLYEQFKKDSLVTFIKVSPKDGSPLT